MRCDLHTHSLFSDGTLTPEEILAKANAIGLSALALCDHNSVAGLPRFLAAAKSYSLKAVPGVELSSDYNDGELTKEVHILALWLPKAAYGEIDALVADMKRQKEESNRRLIARLERAGYSLDYEAICKVARGLPNRAHIARSLCEKGYVRSRDEAFATLLSETHGLYVPPSRPDVLEVIGLLRRVGAVSVLAHPFLTFGEVALLRFLEKACPCGLMAMEARYTTYDDKTTRLAEEVAARFGLLPSGGSDFHGDNKPGVRLGYGKGDLFVPASYVTALEALSGGSI